MKSTSVFVAVLCAGAGCKFDPPPYLHDANPEVDASVDADETPGGAMLVIEQEPHDFSDVTLGEESGTFAVVVANQGDESTGVITIALSGHRDDFQIAQTSDCIDAVLDPDETCTVPVKFLPGTAGPRIASLDVAAAPGGSISFNLTGNGLSPGSLGFTAGSPLMFNTTEISSGSGFESITVRNNGDIATAPLNVVLGDAINFTKMVGDTCQGVELGAGQSCTVQAQFNPTVVGSRSTQLSIRESETSGASSTLSGLGSARLSVTKAGTGTGTVTSTQLGISCGAGCPSAEAVYTESPITLTASVVPGQAFVGWAGACSNAPANPVCAVPLTASVNNVTATFDSSNAILTSSPSLTLVEGGTGTIGVTLRDMPAGDVVVDVSSLGESIATVAPSSLTFHPGDYNDPQDVVVTAVLDDNGTSDSTSIALTAVGAAGGSIDVIANEAAPPTVPSLRRPFNDSYLGAVGVVGSLRPTFAWAASTVGVGSVTYRLQFSTDKTFATAVTNVTTTATSHQPPADLAVSGAAPVGARYYWRVSACVGANCSTPSAVWWANLGRSDQDFNGDGYADVLVGAPSNDVGGSNAGRAYAYFGGAGAAFNTIADMTFTGAAANDGFGRTVAAGDVNGDGFADVLVGATGNDTGGSNAGQAYIYLGGVAGVFDATADGTLTGAAVDDNFGTVGSAGDVNGDGYSDVVVGAPDSDAGASNGGRAYIYHGGPGQAFDSTADGVLTGLTVNASLGSSAESAGDVNGDGYADVIVGAPGSGPGQAFIYLGGPGTSFNSTADGTLTGAANGDRFGASGSAGSAGDVNGDGFHDVIVGAGFNDAGGADAGRAYIYFGAAGTSFEATADATFTGEAATNLFGESVACAGDVNRDGYDDVVIGADQNDAGGTDAGRAYIYFGGPGAINTTVDGMLTGVSASDYFGSVDSAGDVNGDGYDDVIVGAFLGGSGGAAYVYMGGPGVFDVTADGTLLGAAASDSFGTSVASADDAACFGAAVAVRPRA